VNCASKGKILGGKKRNRKRVRKKSEEEQREFTTGGKKIKKKVQKVRKESFRDNHKRGGPKGGEGE